jgi:hypothetical protein
MSKKKNTHQIQTDAEWLSLIKKAEADARSHLPPVPKSKQGRWQNEVMQIIPAKPPERKVGKVTIRSGTPAEPRSYVAKIRKSPYNPEEAARRYKPDQLLKPLRLDLEALHESIWKSPNMVGQGMPLAEIDPIYCHHLAEHLLALCLYAKSRDLTPQEQSIVAYNIGVLRMGLRYPSVRKAAIHFMKKEQRTIQQQPYEKYFAFIEADARKKWKQGPGLRSGDLAREYFDTINPKEFGLTKRPALRTIQDRLGRISPYKERRSGKQQKF